MNLVPVFLVSFSLTVLTEGLLMAALFRRRACVYYSFLCNLLTNPALNLILLLVVNAGGLDWYWPAVILLEVAAILIEAAVYRPLLDFPMKKALALSLLLNAASYATGLLLYKCLLP